MSNKPTFMIVGVQKAGTTTLHNYLQQHTNIYMPAKKELHFFDTPDDIQDDMVTSYLDNFKSADGYPVVGESTPAYIQYPLALSRIKKYFPSIKLVILLRHPIARMYSGYWHERKLGWEDRSFKEALSRKPENYSLDVYHRHFSYLEKSAYGCQLATVDAMFSRSNVKIIRFEKLLANELETVNEVIQFLDGNMSPLTALDSVEKNVAKVPRSIGILKITARLKMKYEKSFVTKALSKINKKEGRYPKISIDEYEFAKDMLIQLDPDILQTYPDL